VFFQLTVLLLEFFEFLSGQGSGAPHALEEHLGQLIPRLHLSLMQQTHEQGSAPRNSLDTPHIHDIKSHGLGGELLHLGTGNAGYQRVCRENRFEPVQAMAPLPHMLEGRPAGRCLHPVECCSTVVDA